MFAPFVPQSAHTTTSYIKPKQEQSFPHSLRSCLTSFAHSFLHLPCPQKKTTLHGKNIRQPCVFNVGCQSLTTNRSFAPHFAFFRLDYPCQPPSFHSLSARASHYGKQESTSLRSAAFPLAFVRLKAALPALFSASPSHSPRPPTPEKEESQLYYSPIGLISLFRS